jgi:hypothetical protein
LIGVTGGWSCCSRGTSPFAVLGAEAAEYKAEGASGKVSALALAAPKLIGATGWTPELAQAGRQKKPIVNRRRMQPSRYDPLLRRICVRIVGFFPG